MIVLFPGTVVVYIPYRILEPTSIPNLVTWSLSHYAAVIVLTCGVAILFKCVRDFAYIGSGTLAPFDETHKLVVIGLYRYVRNPMYVGVMLILLGESWFFWSIRLLEYTGVCFVVANMLVFGRLQACPTDELNGPMVDAKANGPLESLRRNGSHNPQRSAAATADFHR